jgi:hypothetical protein
MNGSLVTVLIAVIGGLFAIVQGLVAIVVRMHMASDDEHRLRLEADINAIRARAHELADKLSDLMARDYLRRKGDTERGRDE